MVELVIAMALLTGGLLPLAYSLASEKRLLLANYRHAVAMEIVDGEMEFLQAGGWRAFPRGTHAYPVIAASATNLGTGEFLITIANNRVRLEWHPKEKHHGGAVMREVEIP